MVTQRRERERGRERVQIEGERKIGIERGEIEERDTQRREREKGK